MVYCNDCGFAVAFTIYDSYKDMVKLQHKVRCSLHNCAKEKDSPVCKDYVRVS